MRDRSRREILAVVLLPATLVGCASRAPFGWSGAKRDRPAILVEVQDRAAFEEGIALVAELKYAEAQEKFAQALTWYQASGDRPRAAETMFWQAFCHEKLNRTDQARELYGRVIRMYRGTPAASHASDRLARLPVSVRSKAPEKDGRGSK
jgi:tetratricopeptide (TPR) repeat protein